MTQQDFVDKISFAYHNSKTLLEGKGGYDIIRGTGHPVSGFMEDAFALYMASRINNKENQYLVDKLISYRGRNGAKAVTLKPDLAILDNSVLTHYYDLKTNLGWNRDLEKYLKKKDALIQRIKGKKGWITFPHVDDENPGKKQEILFSANLRYKIVVYDGWNINQELLARNISFADTLENVELFVLKSWNDKTKTTTVNQDAFDRLY